MIVVQPKIHNSFHIIFRNILDDGLKINYTQKIQQKHFYFETTQKIFSILLYICLGLVQFVTMFLKESKTMTDIC